MSFISFLILLLVAGVCGSLGQSLVGYSHGGCLTSIVLGFIGAMFGMWMARMLGMHEFLALHIGGQVFPVLWSIIGSAVFVGILSLILKRR
ncbi:MAG: hypothetical protein K1Y36_01460 [Blastocatellia bacterium]|nr:hypothetical protein [Blastocatellia bacterium]